MKKYTLTKRVNRIKPSPTLAITAKAKTMKAKGIDVIGFGAGEPDFDTPEHIKEEAIQSIKSGFTKYTAVGGIDELKNAIVKKLKKENGLTYQPAEILVSAGGKHSLYNIAQVLFEKGDEVIIPAPYWVSYPDQVLLADAKPVIIHTTDKSNFKITDKDLEKAITKKTKAVIINSPSNPTGSAYTEAELKKLAKVIIKHQILCISDEIYEKIIYDGFKQISIASVDPKMKDLTIIVNGVSKAYSMTGWRMGFTAGPEEIIKAMSKVQGQSTSNITSITQKACVAAYLGSQKPVKTMLIQFKKRRNYIVKELNKIEGINCYQPDGAFYVFPNISGLFGKKTPQGKIIKTADDFADYLLDDYLVAVVPGAGFGAENYIRLSYATSMENIQQGIKRINTAVKNLK